MLDAFSYSGINVEAVRFNGRLPKEIDLTNARIDFENTTILIDHLHIELSPLALLKKELLIEKLNADGVTFEKIPTSAAGGHIAPPLTITIRSFDIRDLHYPSLPAFSCHGKFQIKPNGHASLNCEIEEPFEAHALAQGTFDNFSLSLSGQFQEFLFKVHVVKKENEPFEFPRLLIAGHGIRVEGNFLLDEKKHLAKGNLQLLAKPFGQPVTAAGSIAGSWEGNRFTGTLEAGGQFLGETWALVTPLSADKTNGVALEELHLKSPLFDGTGDLFWKNGHFSGHLASELNLLLMPYYSLSGHLASTIAFDEEISVDALVTEFSAGSFSCQDASIQGRSKHNAKIELHEAKWNTLNVDAATLTAEKTGENWHSFLSVVGPVLSGQLEGFFRPGQIIVQEASGQYLGVPFNTETPSFIAWSKDQLNVQPLALHVGENGTVSLSLGQAKEKTECQLKLHAFPLSLLSSSLIGDLEMALVVQEINDKTNGQIQASISNALMLVQGDQYVPAKGQLEANLDRNQLHLKANVDVRDSLISSIDLSLPVRIELWPQVWEVYADQATSGTLHCNGKIEEVLDFFRLGMHRLQGNTTCDLSLQGTLANPELKGSFSMENGAYENYLTGTELTDIKAEIKADGNHLILTALTAQDTVKKGKFTATGDLLVSLPEHFPFHLALDFTRMNIVQIDLIAAEAEGHLTIDGDLHSALAKGRIEIVESDIAIPDKIPRSYPDLQVVYKHAQKAAAPPPPKKPYPLNLDIAIDAPEGIFIDGRGLHSEWHGQFAVGGTFTNPSALGKLELIHGEFVFAGRRFQLTEGALSLQGKPYEMPSINIAATTSEKAISITAHIVGPLNKPQITFQSTPPLPMSGILSYLIFGKDLSEVSGIQALQLAGTIASVAGEGPDILEMVRKALGVDRLQIVLTPSGAEGGETLALEIGKIVFPGFTVFIRQGAEDSAPYIGIEVDLTHGFTFGAESIQQPEQGKFSLNWNLNY